MKFVSEPREICHSLLPAKVVSIAVGETKCAAVTGELFCLINIWYLSIQ